MEKLVPFSIGGRKVCCIGGEVGPTWYLKFALWIQFITLSQSKQDKKLWFSWYLLVKYRAASSSLWRSQMSLFAAFWLDLQKFYYSELNILKNIALSVKIQTGGRTPILTSSRKYWIFAHLNDNLILFGGAFHQWDMKE